MHQSLIPLLKIQELDLKMMQLMKLKKTRITELSHLRKIKSDLDKQVAVKEKEIQQLRHTISLIEAEVSEGVVKLKKLEEQQGLVKKVDEFNALSQEIAHAEREKANKESQLSDIYDKLTAEEDILANLKGTLESTSESSKQLEEEIRDRIIKINDEGLLLQAERNELVKEADESILAIYNRLIQNKKDSVIVPIENRCCTGCHTMVTVQDENVVRKGERLIFCEHCSRIHYWPENELIEAASGSSKKRRRRMARA